MANRDPGAWEVIAPVPSSAPAAPSEHYKLGKPTATWTYRDAAGAELGRAPARTVPLFPGVSAPISK